MALQGLLHEGERSVLVAGLGDVALENRPLVIDSAPQVDHLAVIFTYISSRCHRQWRKRTYISTTSRITSGDELK